MSKVVKVIEVLAQSTKSWEDAAAGAVKAASKSVDGIKVSTLQICLQK